MEQIELSEGWVLLLVGGLMLAGYAAHVLGGKVHVPRVTLLMLLGVVLGPQALGLVPEALSDWFPYVAHLALAMVGFLLGESFVGRQLKQITQITPIILGETLLSALFVFLGAFLVSGNAPLALLLAGIAPASAPAATVDVIRENRADGLLSRTVRRVVAIDDAYGVVLFSLLLAAAEALSGERAAMTTILRGFWDVGGAVLVGAVLAFPMSWLTGRLRRGEPALLEALGFVFVCGGLATLLDVSYLLACMTLGVVVANRAKHYTRPFHAIEGASEPFLAVFFLLAGFELDLDVLVTLGLPGVVYVLSRGAGLVLGGRLGSSLAGAPPVITKHVGWCLLPQAGVALGLALLANEKLPRAGETILPLIIATTVVFELVGPLFTQRHVRLAGEIGLLGSRNSGSGSPASKDGAV